MMRLTSSSGTHIGRRSNNEDSYCEDHRLGVFAVADGMGGYEGGEYASRLAVDTITQFFEHNRVDKEITWPTAENPRFGPTENLVNAAVRLANQHIRDERYGHLSRMGSTLAVLVARKGEVVVGHVGDSRVYRLRGGHLKQLTTDHSLYDELIAMGAPDLPPRESFKLGHVVTRALGSDIAEPDIYRDSAQPGDIYLLCTDGLTGTVAEDRIKEILVDHPTEIASARLIEAALDGGARDNITAVVVKIH